MFNFNEHFWTNLDELSKEFFSSIYRIYLKGLFEGALKGLFKENFKGLFDGAFKGLTLVLFSSFTTRALKMSFKTRMKKVILKFRSKQLGIFCYIFQIVSSLDIFSEAREM